MSVQTNTSAKPIDEHAALDALYRAAEMARKTAIDTDTCLVVMEHGKIVRIPAQQLRQQQVKEIAMPVATHDISEIGSPVAALIKTMQPGDEVIFTQQGQKIARLVPIKHYNDEAQAQRRMELVRRLQKSVAEKITSGPDAAHSQDFLYDDDGLPA